MNEKISQIAEQLKSLEEELGDIAIELLSAHLQESIDIAKTFAKDEDIDKEDELLNKLEAVKEAEKTLSKAQRSIHKARIELTGINIEL